MAKASKYLCFLPGQITSGSQIMMRRLLGSYEMKSKGVNGMI